MRQVEKIDSVKNRPKPSPISTYFSGTTNSFFAHIHFAIKTARASRFRI